MSTGLSIFDTTVQESNEWLKLVESSLPPNVPRRPNEAVEAVFAALGARLDPGKVRKLVQHLPSPIRAYWPSEHQVA